VQNCCRWAKKRHTCFISAFDVFCGLSCYTAGLLRLLPVFYVFRPSFTVFWVIERTASWLPKFIWNSALSWIQIAAAMLSGNSLRQTVHTHCASVQAAKLVAALQRVVRVTANLAESNGSLSPGLWLNVTCMCTAKNSDQLQNPTLSSRVWATSTFCLCLYTSALLTIDNLSAFKCQVKSHLFQCAFTV